MIDKAKRAGRPKGTTRPEQIGLEERELEQLFKAADDRKDKAASLWLRLTFFLGLRVRELSNLKLTDIYQSDHSLADWTITVQGIKNGRKRCYRGDELGGKLMKRLSDWILRDRNADHNNPYLFPGKLFDSPMNPDSFKGKFKRLAKVASLPGYLSIHSLRHATAQAMVRRGMSPVAIMAWLRHRDIASTQKYFEKMATEISPETRELFRDLG